MAAGAFVGMQLRSRQHGGTNGRNREHDRRRDQQPALQRRYRLAHLEPLMTPAQLRAMASAWTRGAKRIEKAASFDDWPL
jgi:hypothetical protein